jgi:hypothetical protein
MSWLIGYVAFAPRSEGQSRRGCPDSFKLRSKPEDFESCRTGIFFVISAYFFTSIVCFWRFIMWKIVLICILEMQWPADLADPNSPAQVRLNVAVEKLNAERTET